MLICVGPLNECSIFLSIVWFAYFFAIILLPLMLPFCFHYILIKISCIKKIIFLPVNLLPKKHYNLDKIPKVKDAKRCEIQIQKSYLGW